jgi:acyl-CoA thioesterase YciA
VQNKLARRLEILSSRELTHAPIVVLVHAIFVSSLLLTAPPNVGGVVVFGQLPALGNPSGQKPTAKSQKPDSLPMPTAPRSLALRVVTMPRDTNQYGTIFGGVIMSYIDQAGFVEARRHGVHRWVTASMERVDFKAPVHLGDTVNFYATTTREGTKSVTVQIEVEAERYTSGQTVPVTTATLTMVAVDAAGQPIPFKSPPTAAAP